MLGVAVAFGKSLLGPFHFDDRSLFSNPLVTDVSGWWRIWTPIQTRPLTFFTFWLNYRLGGENPIGYHAVNLLLHGAVVLLLYHVLRKLINKNAAFFAAGFFAIHPIQSEAVAYVFARGSLLCALFCLLSLNEWLRGRRWPAVAWFALALLAKEECVTFPFVIILLLVSLKAFEKEDRPAAGAMFALAGIAGLRAAFATKVVAGSGAGFTAGVTPFHYVAAQGLAIVRYLRLLVVPWGFTIEPDLLDRNAYLCVLAWIGTIVLIGFARSGFGRLKWGFWCIAGLVLLIPSSSVFPAADLAADHRMYLPMIAFAAIAGLVARNWNVWIPGAVAMGLIFLSFLRMDVWKTEHSLWEEAASESPNKVRPLIQLSRTATTDQALDLLIQAKMVAPNDASIAADLGVLWFKMGRRDNALQEFGRALALTPHDPNAMANRGAALLSLGQNDAAQRDLEQALKIDPCLESARINLEHLGRPLPACPTAK
jgi:hypothetical protein